LLNKTASAAHELFTVRRSALDRRAQRLRLIRTRKTRFAVDKHRVLLMLLNVGGLPHFIGLRAGDEHVAHLDALAKASGFTRGEILRRLLLSTEIPSARARQEVQELVRIQRAQNRLGGLLKKALTEREDKASLRQTLAEIERNAVELRRAVAYLVRSQ